MCVCVCVHACVNHSVVSDSMQPHGLLCPGDFPGKSTGVCCHSLLQGIFLTQALNPACPTLQADSIIWATREVPKFSSPVKVLVFWCLLSALHIQQVLFILVEQNSYKNSYNSQSCVSSGNCSVYRSSVIFLWKLVEFYAKSVILIVQQQIQWELYINF